jgi:hypothetical protein
VGLTLMTAPSHLLHALYGWEVEASCPAILQHCHAVLLLFCCCAAWCKREAQGDAALCVAQLLAAPIICMASDRCTHPRVTITLPGRAIQGVWCWR